MSFKRCDIFHLERIMDTNSRKIISLQPCYDGNVAFTYTVHCSSTISFKNENPRVFDIPDQIILSYYFSHNLLTTAISNC